MDLIEKHIMSNQETRGILANLYSLILTDGSIQLVNKRIEALGMAISALEKQIPKKLQNIHRFRGREKCVGTCPTCGYTCYSDYGDYWGGCGQAIDWRRVSDDE